MPLAESGGSCLPGRITNEGIAGGFCALRKGIGGHNEGVSSDVSISPVSLYPFNLQSREFILHKRAFWHNLTLMSTEHMPNSYNLITFLEPGVSIICPAISCPIP